MRILLIDPHDMFREAIRLMLEREPEWKVVGQVGEGSLGLEMAERLEPDLVVMECVLPRLSGIEVARQLGETQPRTPILMLSGNDRPGLVRAGLLAGVKGWITKRSSADELTKGIEIVAAGGTYLSPDVMPSVVGALAGQSGADENGFASLSSRERQSLQLIGEGYSSKEMAELMFVSVRTVESYRARLMDKLGIHKVAQLVRYAIREGLVEP